MTTLEINRKQFLSAIETPFKASTALNLSTFSNQGIILFRFTPTSLQLFGYSSSIMALSELYINSEIDEIVLLIESSSLIKFLKKSKEEFIEITPSEGKLEIVTTGLYTEAEYKDIGLIFPYQEVEKMLNIDVNRISDTFTRCLKQASKYPYRADIQASLAGIALYQNYVFGLQREKGIILKLDGQANIPNLIPTSIADALPIEHNCFGDFKETAILQFKINDEETSEEIRTTTLKFSLMAHKFNEKYGEVLLNYINMEKGKMIFSKKQMSEALNSLLSLQESPDHLIHFKFEEKGWVDLHSFSSKATLVEPIAMETENIDKLQNFKINGVLLKELLSFCKEAGDEFIIYVHPAFRFDLPLIVNNKENWLYASVAKI